MLNLEAAVSLILIRYIVDTRAAKFDVCDFVKCTRKQVSMEGCSQPDFIFSQDNRFLFYASNSVCALDLHTNKTIKLPIYSVFLFTLSDGYVLNTLSSMLDEFIPHNVSWVWNEHRKIAFISALDFYSMLDEIKNHWMFDTHLINLIFEYVS